MNMDDASKKTNNNDSPSHVIPGELSDVDVGCIGPTGELLRQSSASSVSDCEVIDPGELPTNIYK